MKSIHSIFSLFLFLLAAYQLLRLGFLLNNLELVQQASLLEIAKTFLIGIRFDLAAIAITNAPIILLYLFPLPIKGRVFIVSFLFALVNGFFLALNVGDIEYFQFSARRVTYSSFLIQKDIVSQFWQILVYYWPLSILNFSMPIFLWFLGKNKVFLAPMEKLPKLALSFLLGLFLIVFFGRGGWQAKPLIPAHAFIDLPVSLAQLGLNSSFSLIKSLNREMPPRLEYFESDEVAREILADSSKVDLDILAPDTNVVVIILESFSLEYMGEVNGRVGYTPFLDKLAKNGIFFSRHLASGRRSIDAIPSIMAALPAWMDQAFITSQFQTNRLMGIGEVLAHYDSSFFHGGFPGTMFMDVMASRSGFKRYVDAALYPDKTKEDGHWGIYDEDFLTFSVDEISVMQRPFLAGIFTLSSHQPYSIPAKYNNKFPKGKLEIHESIGYADHALEQFFTKASKQPWYKNTLFVITADHTSKVDDPKFASAISRFRVPLIFFHPEKKLSIPDDLVMQHTDITPSILSLFEIDYPFYFGKGFDQQENRLALVRSGESYYALTSEWIVEYRSPDTWRYFNSDDWMLAKPLPKPASHQQIQDKILARLQLFGNGLLDDRLLPQAAASK